MDNICIKWFASFTISVLMEKNKFVLADYLDCKKKTTSSGLLLAECIDSLGQDLPEMAPLGLEKLQVLHVLRAPNFVLVANLFDPFKETLVELKMSGLFRYPYEDRGKVPLDIFATLTKLQTIEIIGSQLIDYDEWKYPESLVRLTLDNNKYKNLKLPRVKNLEELTIDGNLLTDVPKFDNPAPPLHLLSLRRNNLALLSVKSLAQFCELQKLELEYRPTDDFFKAACPCTFVTMWMKEFHITGRNFTCSNPTQECDRGEWENAIEVNNELCPTAFERFLLKRYQLIIGIALSILVLGILLAFSTYEYCKKSPVVVEPESLEEEEALANEEEGLNELL